MRSALDPREVFGDPPVDKRLKFPDASVCSPYLSESRDDLVSVLKELGMTEAEHGELARNDTLQPILLDIPLVCEEVVGQAKGAVAGLVAMFEKGVGDWKYRYESNYRALYDQYVAEKQRGKTLTEENTALFLEIEELKQHGVGLGGATGPSASMGVSSSGVPDGQPTGRAAVILKPDGSMPHALDVGKRSKCMEALERQLPILRSGHSIGAWITEVKENVHMYGQGLVQGEVCNLILKNISKSGITRFSLCTEGHPETERKEDYRAILEVVQQAMRPMDDTFGAEFEDLRQKPAETSGQFLKRALKVFTGNMQGMPLGADLKRLVYKMQPTYKAHFLGRITFHEGAGKGPLSWQNFMDFAERCDQQMAPEGGWTPAGRQPQQQGSRPPPPPPQPGRGGPHVMAAGMQQGYQQMHMGYQQGFGGSFGQSGNGGRGPGGGGRFGHGGWTSAYGQQRHGQQPFMALPPDSAAASGQHQQLRTSALSISAAAQATFEGQVASKLSGRPTVAICTSPAAMLAMETRGAAVQRTRPARAEVVTGEADTGGTSGTAAAGTGGTALAPEPNRAGTRAALKQAVRRLREVPINMRIGDAAVLHPNPAWQQVLSGIAALVSEAGLEDEPPIGVRAMAPADSAALQQPEEDSRAEAQPVGIHMGGPRVMAQAASVVAAAPTFSEMVVAPTVNAVIASMPRIAANIDSKASNLGGARVIRMVAVDSGGGMSSISRAAFDRDKEILVGNGARIVHLASPLPIGTYSESHTIAATMLVTNVSLGIGEGEYRHDMLVVEGAGHEYLVGAEFVHKYDGQFRWRTRMFNMGLPEACRARGSRYKQPYQQVPLDMRTTQVTWRVKSSL